MKQHIFDPQHNYHIKFDIKIGGLCAADVNALFKDGRVASHIIDKSLSKLFNNIHFRHNSGSPSDLTLVAPSPNNITKTSHYKLESKTLTAGGLRLIPSGQLGKGRSFDMSEALARATLVDYYVLTDIRQSPVFSVYTITSQQAQHFIKTRHGAWSNSDIAVSATKNPNNPLIKINFK